MIDERGHEVPGEDPTEPWLGHVHFRNLANSIQDIAPVANATAQAVLVDQLRAAGRGPSTQRPLYVDRLDLIQDEGAQSRILRTTDGTNWQALTGVDVHKAVTQGATFPPAGGTLGVTSALVIPADPWPRWVELDWQGLATAVPAGTAGFILRRGTTGLSAGRATTTSVSGSYTDLLAAGATASYQLVAEVTSAVVVSADARFTALTATVRPA